MASYEFHTLLTSILFRASLIDSYTITEGAEKRNRHTVRVAEAVEDLLDTINSFLSLEQIEKGLVEIEQTTFNLPGFLKSIAEGMKGMLSKRNQPVTIHHVGDTTITQTKKILKNIQLNLLSNASKYSLDKKEIQIISEVKKGHVTINVKKQWTNC